MAKKEMFNESANQGTRLRVEDLTDIVCENCGGRFFKEVNAFKRVPELISPTGKEQIIPVPTFRCDDCGHVNEEFMPK